jgi:hypothetical protein
LPTSRRSPSVEYFNAGFGHYFMTADSDEITGLDAGAFNHAFVRTNRTFKVLDAPAAGTAPVCRFFTTPGTFGAKSSHFYTADPVECEGLKLNPNWIYEKIAFHIAVPVGGACAGGHGAGVPRVQQRPDRRAEPPVHDRPRALPAVHDDAGVAAEGIAFCAPV